MEDITSKYQELLNAANQLAQEGVVVVHQGNKLLVHGETTSPDAKNKLWDIYSQLNPNYVADDVELDVRVSASVEGRPSRLPNTDDGNTILRKGPGTAIEAIAELNGGEELEMLSRANDNWWLVRTKDGKEGYCYVRCLEILD